MMSIEVLIFLFTHNDVISIPRLNFSNQPRNMPKYMVKFRYRVHNLWSTFPLLQVSKLQVKAKTCFDNKTTPINEYAPDFRYEHHLENFILVRGSSNSFL